MAAYREDECNIKDWEASGLYTERGNQNPNYNDQAAHFDYSAWVPADDCSPEQKDAPGVSVDELTTVAPYVFDSSKL